jgi:uncharacterized protein YkwD
MLATRFVEPTRGQPGKNSQCIQAGLVVAIALVASACGSGGGDATSAPVQAAAAGPSPAPAPAPAPTPAAGPAPAPSPAPMNVDALKRINDARAVARNCGTTAFAATTPVQWNTDAEDAARTQVIYLQSNNLFTHTGANGSSVGDRLTATGYQWSTVGENIAAGYPDLASVMDGWLNSPGHCANIMNPAFVDVGVALQPGTSANTYGTYWGMVLAKPSS